VCQFSAVEVKGKGQVMVMITVAQCIARRTAAYCVSTGPAYCSS